MAQTRSSWFVLTDILLANGDELNLILPKFARPLYLFIFFLSGFLALP